MEGKGGSIDIELSDFTVPPSEVNPHGVEPGLYMRMEVRDSGVGMPSHVIERIFDPFFTTKKTGEGTGLGLAVVQDIVKQHRGYVTVESEEGKGSVFTIYLPRIPEEPATGSVFQDEAAET